MIRGVSRGGMPPPSHSQPLPQANTGGKEYTGLDAFAAAQALMDAEYPRTLLHPCFADLTGAKEAIENVRADALQYKALLEKARL